MIRVLIAETDDSTARYLTGLFLTAGMEVVGIAGSGREAIEKVQKISPDVLVMDLDISGTDAVAAVAAIMRSAALPIVVMTDTGKGANGAEKAFQAMKAGALSAVIRPDLSDAQWCSHRERELVKTARLMSEVKVVTRRGREKKHEFIPAPPGPDFPVIAIGASTGGPPVLQTILAELPKNLPAALLIVQHISVGFLAGLRQWLQDTTAFPVKIPAGNEAVVPGCAYLAPENYHMGITRQGTITLSSAEPEAGLRPAVSYLFRSVLDACGSRACGILLTGMGADGAKELKAMRNSGGITIVQDKASSAIFGMPGRAVQLGAAVHIYNPHQIAGALPEIAVQIQRLQLKQL